MSWTLYEGDCLKIMPTLPAESVDAVITDPPYGMGKDYGSDCDKPEKAIYLIREAMPLIYRLMKLGTLMFIFGSPKSIFGFSMVAHEVGFVFHRYLWIYKPNDCTYPWRGWLLKSEAIAIFSKGQPPPWTRKDYCHDTYIFNHSGGELPKSVKHPSVKPFWIVRDLVRKAGQGIILDPFAGTGTTLLAAEQEGRDSIGIEINPQYCNIIRRRMSIIQKPLLHIG